MEVKEILKEVCSILDMDVDVVLSGSRKREIINVKKIVAYISYGYNHTLQHIAGALGLQNHVTIINLRDKAYNAIFGGSDELLFIQFSKCHHLENEAMVCQKDMAIELFEKLKLNKESFIKHLLLNYKIIKRKK